MIGGAADVRQWQVNSAWYRRHDWSDLALCLETGAAAVKLVYTSCVHG